MFKKVLFPTDFSEASKAALEELKKLKSSGVESVVLIHVIDQRSFQAIDNLAGMNSHSLEKEIMAQATQQMERVEEELSASGFEIKSLLKIGFPVREILKAEKEEDITITVIGSHGKSNLEEIFLGSVSEKVIRKTKKPVLVIKRQ